MQDYGTKVDNSPASSEGVLTAAEFNNFINEMENIITTSGQTLNTGNAFQAAMSISTYAVTGAYFLDSGVTNTYTLATVGTRRAPYAYVDGMRIRFFAANTNSGASTVNIASLGTKDIRRPDGNTLTSGDIAAGSEIEITYRDSLGYFIISQYVKVIGNQNIFNKKTFDTVPDTTQDPVAGNDLVRYSFLQSYVSANTNVIPAGTMFPYFGASAPTGYLLSYGQAVSRTTYAALFAIIGTTYGSGDGSTTFNLPDLRGRAIFGKDNMGGSAVNRITLNGTTLGGIGGSEYHTLVVGEMPSHAHDIPTSYGYTSSGSTITVVGRTPTSSNPSNNIGGGAAHNNMSPYIIGNYIIKY